MEYYIEYFVEYCIGIFKNPQLENIWQSICCKHWLRQGPTQKTEELLSSSPAHKPSSATTKQQTRKEIW